MPADNTKPWGGRFSAPTDTLLQNFSNTVLQDQNFALDDVLGSQAHVAMLAEVGLLTKNEGEQIQKGLLKIREEISTGTFPWREAYEDVHMNVEVRLGELIGVEIAGKLHTARSRNDQVALDLKLYLRRKLTNALEHCLMLEVVLLKLAEKNIDVLLPGYTHLQRAQPIRLSHVWLAYYEMFSRDRERIEHLLERIMRFSPLGSGALAGTPHPIDRLHAAKTLGFEDVTRNSLDAVSDRDHAFEALSIASLSMIHLSRLSEDLILWSTQEFGFVEIPDGFATGSSMMPQKKNPDIPELVRGKSGPVIGALISLLVTLKSLPLAYNRDLQEDKPPLYLAFGHFIPSLEVMARLLDGIEVRKDRMAEALKDGFVLATELADYLVTKGVPFRDAHHASGKLVAEAVKTHRRLEELKLDELRAVHPAFESDVKNWLDYENAVERRNIVGAPAKKQIVLALQNARASHLEAQKRFDSKAI